MKYLTCLFWNDSGHPNQIDPVARAAEERQRYLYLLSLTLTTQQMLQSKLHWCCSEPASETSA